MKSILALTLVSLAAVSGDPFFADTKKNVNVNTAATKTYNISKLLQRATPTATFERTQEENQRFLKESRFSAISSFWLRFEKCQSVKEYEDEIAAYDRGSDTVFASEQFVIFRLCPSEDSCHSECSENFGEYVIPLSDYLVETTYQQFLQEEMCETCYETCHPEKHQKDCLGKCDPVDSDNTHPGVNCQKCVEECQIIENMGENGYIDAENFVSCQMIYDSELGVGESLFAGPICGNHGDKINIGVFTDPECKIEDPTKNVEDYLMDSEGHHMKLAHALLKNVYNRDSCISCRDPLYPTDEEWTLDMCGYLYDESAKCERPHGFNNGVPIVDGQSKNQMDQENAVCDFVETLKGEKPLSEELHVFLERSDNGKDSTTKGQSFLLHFSILACVGLVGTAMFLHRKLMKKTKSSFTDSVANANYELIPMEGNREEDYQELS